MPERYVWRENGNKRPATKGETGRYLREFVLRYDGDDCLMWPFAKSGMGYGQIKQNGRSADVHRLVCEHINGAPPTPKHEAAHSCGKGHLGCVSPRHLSWKTHAENHADRLRHGTSGRGEDHSQTNLTWADVAKIRAMTGLRLQREIAAEFGVTPSTVGNILRGDTWVPLNA